VPLQAQALVLAASQRELELVRPEVPGLERVLERPEVPELGEIPRRQVPE
jgi:hypothetical protein